MKEDGSLVGAGVSSKRQRAVPVAADQRIGGSTHEAGSVRRRSGFGGSQRLGVVPGHPRTRIDGDCGDVALQGDEVVERLALVQFRGMDQAHEQVADAPGRVGQREPERKPPGQAPDRSRVRRRPGLFPVRCLIIRTSL